MPRHTKAWKFKRPLSQNEEPFRTKNLFMYSCLGTVIPRESGNSEELIVSWFDFWLRHVQTKNKFTVIEANESYTNQLYLQKSTWFIFTSVYFDTTVV